MNHYGAKVLAALILVLSSSSWAAAGRGVYARKAVAFPTRCWPDQVKECRALRLPSPDGHSAVSVRYHKEAMRNGDFVLLASLQVTQKDGTSIELDAPGLVEAELLWSPDSSSFLINWSNAGMGDQGVEIYRLGELRKQTGGEAHSVIAAAQRDMLERFPPCRARDADPKDCVNLANHPEAVDVAAVDWMRGSSAIIVVAEIPCSSRYGGIMCEVLGYELDASTGKILRRMQPREFAGEWQHSMAWRFHLPDPPKYQGK
jgi:hypothetical protein